MDCPSANSSLTLKSLHGFFLGLLLIVGSGALAKVPPVREFSLSSFSDSLFLKKDGGEKIPLSARAYGIFAGYGRCLNIYFKRNCVFASGGLGLSSVVVESGTSSYIYRDGGSLALQGTAGGGVKHYFPRSLSTALLSLDLELRKASYKSPSATYSIRDENQSYHLWLRTQFNFPLSANLSFYQALLFAPMGSEFSYRLGISL
jgi:hypothetical protein